MGNLPEAERAIVLYPNQRSPDGFKRDAVACLEEAVGLTRAIELNVCHADVVPLSRPRPATPSPPASRRRARQPGRRIA